MCISSPLSPISEPFLGDASTGQFSPHMDRTSRVSVKAHEVGVRRGSVADRTQRGESSSLRKQGGTNMSAQENEEQPEASADRRRVLGAAAWVAPIIAMSIAAPAQAASANESPA
ncbi:hypothetical protein ACFPRL_23835 [Pseudoclavibacter helvolus]